MTRFGSLHSTPPWFETASNGYGKMSKIS